jgi:hypothetical protein
VYRIPEHCAGSAVRGEKDEVEERGAVGEDRKIGKSGHRVIGKAFTTEITENAEEERGSEEKYIIPDKRG